MSVTVSKSKTVTTMLWPDGRVDIPAEILQELGVVGGWECKVEIVNGAIVVRPEVAIPDEDLWAYEPETKARLLEAAREPVGSGIQASPQDLRDLMEGRLSIEELLARSRS